MAAFECPILHSSWDEEAAIAKYFKDGYAYEEMCMFLHLRHKCDMTIDQLHYKWDREEDAVRPLEVVEAAIMV